MPPFPPKKRISQLEKEAQQIMRIIIKEYCKTNSIYYEANKKGLGLEQTEEIVENLIDEGELKVYKLDESNYTVVPWFVKI